MTDDVLFRQAEICNLDIAISSDKHVLRLEVSVEDVLRMEMVQCKEDVGGIEPSCVLLESSNLTQVEKELPTWAVLKHERQFAIALECVIHLDDKRVSDIFL